MQKPACVSMDSDLILTDDGSGHAILLLLDPNLPNI